MSVDKNVVEYYSRFPCVANNKLFTLISVQSAVFSAVILMVELGHPKQKLWCEMIGATVQMFEVTYINIYIINAGTDNQAILPAETEDADADDDS